MTTVGATIHSALELPLIELKNFFNKEADSAAYKVECEKVAHCFREYGICVLKDPRVSEADNQKFLNMMEKYFELSDGVRDARPEYAYQVGVTSENIEKPRDHSFLYSQYGPDDQPVSPLTPQADPKWRFFWRTGPLPPKTDFPIQNMDAVIPPEFPEWKEIMDMWGGKMTDALFTLAEMAAVGFDMPDPNSFTNRMQYGPHLLAPTGSNYNKYNKVGTVLAGFHYDLNFMTIHGKCRYPGLYVWTRAGTKASVAVPEGCLLVQAGKQFELMTGGYIQAGYHEVVITDATAKVIEDRKAKGESLWRVSSTCFGHIASDQYLEPLAPFNSPEVLEKYPPIKAGHMVQRELEAIELSRGVAK